MGYTHYWRRVGDIERNAFSKALEDIRLVIETLSSRGMKFAGPSGSGSPELTDQTIAFNGKRECGHRYRDLGKPWPSKNAEGVEANNNPVVGPWFSGALLDTRVCGGNCAGEHFLVDRSFLLRSWDQLEDGRYFCSCETQYKPYDLLVTAALVRLKERLGDQILISSDGGEQGFADAKRLCRELFGFATHFELETQDAPAVI
jgi:hypothetical protein